MVKNNIAKKTTLEERITIVEHCIANANNYALTAQKYKCSYGQVYSWVKPKKMGAAEMEDALGGSSNAGKSSNVGRTGSDENGENSDNNAKNWKSGQKRKLKFTYQEQKDYENIEGEMAALEEKIAQLEKEFLQCASDFVKLNALSKEKEEAEKLLEEKMERWMYLEELAARIENGEMVDI